MHHNNYHTQGFGLYTTDTTRNAPSELRIVPIELQVDATTEMSCLRIRAHVSEQDLTQRRIANECRNKD